MLEKRFLRENHCPNVGKPLVANRIGVQLPYFCFFWPTPRALAHCSSCIMAKNQKDLAKIGQKSKKTPNSNLLDVVIVFFS